MPSPGSSQASDRVSPPVSIRTSSPFEDEPQEENVQQSAVSPSPDRSSGYQQQLVSPSLVAQLYSPTYMNALRSIHGSNDREIWALGRLFLTKERPKGPPADEVQIYEFLQKHTTIPVPEIIHSWTRKGILSIFMETSDGEQLSEAWVKMAIGTKIQLADQVAAYLCQLRKLTSAYMGRVNEQPLLDCFLFDGVYPPVSHGPFSNDVDLWGEMASLLSSSIPKEALSLLGESMPDCSPYTFSHGNLSLENIIVNGGNVVGIIDWEWAGFYPVWWEHTRLSISPDVDEEWKQLLRSRMDEYPLGEEFWRNYYDLKLVGSGVESRGGQKTITVLLEL